MKTKLKIVITAIAFITLPGYLFSQSEKSYKELGIDVGGFSNFPANQDYLTKNMSALYVAPYLRIGRHEISAGLAYTLPTDGLYYTDVKLDGRPGAIAGYKLYLFNPFGRENMFIHYSFEYLGLKGVSEENTEKDIYINNSIGLGYNIFFDSDARFGLYYILDYVISHTGYKRSDDGVMPSSWTTNTLWNRLSTHIGLSFKITELKKKPKH